MHWKGSIAVVFSSALFLALVADAPSRSATRAPTTVCVSPLSNNTGDARFEPLAEAVADILAVMLAEHEGTKVVERHELRKVLREQKLSLAGLADPATAVRIGKLLRADRILVGGIIKQRDKLLISVQAYEISSARLACSVRVQGKADDVSKLIKEVAEELGKRLKVVLRPVDTRGVDRTPKASACFMRGLGLHFAGNYDRAVMEFMKAQDLDPKLDRAGYWIALSFMKNKEFKHALIELEALLRKHARSPFRDEARKLIEECRKNLPTQPASPPAKSGAKKKDEA